RTLSDSRVDFVAKHGAEIGWDLVVLNPPLVLGPMIHAVASVDTLNHSTRMMYNAFMTPGAAGGSGRWTDVRDLALAHVRALQREPAGGERIIVAAGTFTWQDWRAVWCAVDAAPPASRYQKGTPGAGKDHVHLLRYDNGKSVRVLGMEYRSMADTAEAVVADYEARGW
ncbi:hypothetical protein GGX14DRAFT_382988, partial [Mycena pura]